MPNCKIRQDDEVIIIAGRDSGQRGKVLRIKSRTDKRTKKSKLVVLVEGVNLVKKHMKPNPQMNQQGGIVERESFMDISNVAVINPSTDKADRVGYKHLEDGRKVRFCKSNGEVLDVKE